jgi:hypothetical protein
MAGTSMTGMSVASTSGTPMVRAIDRVGTAVMAEVTRGISGEAGAPRRAWIPGQSH